MFPLTLREDKGSPLTHQEMDNNLKHVMFPPFLHIQDQKPQGTPGGTFTSGAWQTRDLNTVLTNTISGASLATNQITLPAGKYYVEASAPTSYVNQSQAVLRNVSLNLDMLVGSIGYSYRVSTSSIAGSISSLFGVIEISDSSLIELRHICTVTLATSGFGTRGNFTTEVYSDIRIWRIGDVD